MLGRQAVATNEPISFHRLIQRTELSTVNIHGPTVCTNGLKVEINGASKEQTLGEITWLLHLISSMVPPAPPSVDMTART